MTIAEQFWLYKFIVLVNTNFSKFGNLFKGIVEIGDNSVICSDLIWQSPHLKQMTSYSLVLTAAIATLRFFVCLISMLPKFTD